MTKAIKIIGGLLVVVGLVGGVMVFVSRFFPTQGEDDVYLGASVAPLPITEVTQTRHAEVGGSSGCDVRLLYPQIAATAEIDAAIREQINDLILKQVTDFFSAEAPSLDEAATAWAMECQTDLGATLADADLADDPAASATLGWVSEIGYDMKLNDGTYLSLGIANYLQTGGAHPNTTELFLTFDVATGNLLTLRDIVSSEKIMSFETSEKQWLIDNASDMLFEESLNEFKGFVASPTQEKANAYVDDAIFYLSPTEIVTFYNPYMIAPYAAGPLEVRLPRS